jgi:hypothetical protein
MDSKQNDTDQLTFYTAGKERMIIDSSNNNGNIGIGTLQPKYALDVSGVINGKIGNFNLDISKNYDDISGIIGKYPDDFISNVDLLFKNHASLNNIFYRVNNNSTITISGHILDYLSKNGNIKDLSGNININNVFASKQLNGQDIDMGNLINIGDNFDKKTYIKIEKGISSVIFKNTTKLEYKNIVGYENKYSSNITNIGLNIDSNTSIGNSISQLDNWLLKMMFSQPPRFTDLSFNRFGTNVEINWKLPPRYKLAYTFAAEINYYL